MVCKCRTSGPEHRSGTKDKQLFPISPEFPNQKYGHQMEVQEKEKETLLCLLSTMWQLVQQDSGAEGLQGSVWTRSWKKGQQSLCCTSTEALACRNLKLQAAVESGEVLGTQLPVLRHGTGQVKV